MMNATRTANAPAVFGLLLAITGLLASGCGYHNGAPDAAIDPHSNGNAPAWGSTGYQWKSIYRQDVRTVAVPIFTNSDYQRGVEFALSKAVVNQIESNTPYKVVPRERADTILEGAITLVQVRTISEGSRSGIPQEQLLDVTVNFTWKDLRTGRILVDRRGMEQAGTYYPTLGEDRFEGTQAVVEQLARTIVDQMEAEW
jgi:hypothetical protein